MHNTDVLHRAVEQITKTNQKDQDFLLRYFSRLPLTLKVELENKKRKLFHMMRESDKSTEKNILSYASFILAIKYHYALEKSFTTKKFHSMSLEEIRSVSTIKLQRQNYKRYLSQNEKRSKLLHYWSVVKIYRTQKPKPVSFQKISELLKKHYHFSVSHNTIALLWRELEDRSDIKEETQS